MKSLSIKIVSTLTVLLLMVGLCTMVAFTEETVHLRAGTWDTAEGAHWIRVAFDKFEEQHPEIEIELQAMPAGYDDRIITGIAADNPPDIFMWWNYPKLVALGGLEPLDDLGINFDNLSATLNLYNSVDGKIYGVAKDFTTRVIWYNKKIFDEAGVPYPTNDWTWDEFRAIAKQLTNKEKNIFGFHIAPDSYDWQGYVWSNRGDLVDAAGTTMEGYLNSPETIEAIKFLTDLYLVDKVSPSPAAASAMGGDYEMLTAGRVAMIDSGMWLLGYCKAREIDPALFGTVMSPCPEGKKRVSVLHTCGWSLATASKHKEEAIKVLKFIADEGGKTMAEAGWAFPTSLAVAKECGLLDDSITNTFFDALDSCTVTPCYARTVDWWEKFDTYIAKAFDAILLEKSTVEEALNEAIRESEAALER